MIQPNELRIGNYIEYFIEDKFEGDEWVLNKVDEDDIVFCVLNKEQFNLSYRPIPLTPEVLENCGFEKVGGYYSKSPIIFHEYYIEIEANDTSYRGSIVPLYNCKYLHQLQNLYFALTVEELEYKP